MTSSGTYNFNPAASDVIRLAYGRIQIRGTALTAEHMRDAVIEANLMQAEFNTLQPNLWRSETITQALTQGTATYTLAGRVIDILIGYIRTGSGVDTADRVLGALSTTEYAALPNKTTQAPPTAFWLDRQITPQITFWQVPDGGGPYTAYLQCVSTMRDFNAVGGLTLDMPNRFLDAFIAGLTVRVARLHRPEALAEAKQEAARTWQLAAAQDTENVQMSIQPRIKGYWNR